MRQANIIAVGKTAVLKLTAAAFNETIGDLAELVEANFKRKVMESIDINGTKLLAAMSPDSQACLLATPSRG